MLSCSRRNVIRDFILLLAGSAVATASQSMAGDMPLAIQGYDPVAYFTDGTPRRGSPKFEYEWDEHRYWFFRAENRELFRTDPLRYAPQFANYCAMSLAQGMIVEADPKNWLISDGKLYLFGKSIGPELFEKDLAANVAGANQNRARIQKH
jgi:hypothetical protein